MLRLWLTAVDTALDILHCVTISKQNATHEYTRILHTWHVNKFYHSSNSNRNYFIIIKLNVLICVDRTTSLRTVCTLNNDENYRYRNYTHYTLIYLLKPQNKTKRLLNCACLITACMRYVHREYPCHGMPCSYHASWHLSYVSSKWNLKAA